MTEPNEEIEEKLVEFDNILKAIPYYAVYRPGKAPHHFNGDFVGARGFLKKAGISSSDAPKLNKVKGERKPKAESDEVADALATPAG